MYGIIQMETPYNRRTIGIFPTYGEAAAHANAFYEIACFVEDDDVDYAAADFLTTSGEVYSIEPVKDARHDG